MNQQTLSLQDWLQVLPTGAADTWRVYVDIGLFILIWLVQLIIYPSFLYVRESDFVAWHHKYTGLITIFVLPLMFGQSALYSFLSLSVGRWHDWLGLIFLTLVWLSTFSLSVPCHQKLHTQGYDARTIQRMVNTNWIRTILWSLMLVVDLLFVTQHAA